MPVSSGGFTAFRINHSDVRLRDDLMASAPAIVARVNALWREKSGAGNRAGGFRLAIDGAPDLFVRLARRGGAMRFITSDLHLGLYARAMRELGLTAEALRRGIPVVEPIGAIVNWLAPLVYRAAFISRAMRGMTLWEFLCADDDPTVRMHVLELARAAIETMHEKGLFHADLNLHNLFVTHARESFSIVILDLDKARMFPKPLGLRLRRANLARLARSARKLDPEGRRLDAAARRILCE